MKNTIIEEVIVLDIGANTNMAAIEVATDSDGTNVVQCVIFTTGAANAGLVQAAIVVDGVPVSKMQPIQNYRSREAAYMDNKPVYFQSGKKVRFEVRANVNFTSNGQVVLVLIKEKQSNC